MNLRSLFYFTFLLTILWSCKNKTQPVVEENKKEQVIEGTAATPVEDKETAPATSTTGAPEYMNIDLQGFGTPDANLNNFYGKVVFVNHWGSWCPPCRMEMPSIQQLYNDYGDKVEFVMIAMEKKQGAHVPYIEREGFTFPVYTALSPIVTEMKPRAFPTTIILDKEGKIRINDVGAKDWNAPQVREMLDELLAQ